MASRDVRLALMQDLLAAPGSDAGWSAFLLRLCDALRGSAASFIAHDFRAAATGIAITARTDPEALAEYQAHWHQFDPWATSPAVSRSRYGTVVSGEALIPKRDLHRTGFYNDFGRRYGIVQCLAGVIEVSNTRLSCLSIDADGRRHEFDARDAALLHSLMPSVQRALQLHRRLAGAELMSLHSAAVLDRLPHGVFLIAANGAVTSTNLAAEAILRAHDGLVYDNGELRGATAADTSRLRFALRAATSPEIETSPAEGQLLLTRPSGRRPLVVVIAPLTTARHALSEDGARAVMFVTDSDRMAVPDVNAIMRLFALTPAEAKLVRCLASGLTLEQAAVELGVRIETVRSRLKVVFQKTGTHRQAELVRLVVGALVAGGVERA